MKILQVYESLHKLLADKQSMQLHAKVHTSTVKQVFMGHTPQSVG